MTNIPVAPHGAAILHADDKGPWGEGGDGKGAGPRNPWSVPPNGRRGPPRPSALDDLLARARGGGAGGGGGSPGRRPAPRTLWAIGTSLIVGLWLLLSCVHLVGARQQGVATLLGAYDGTVGPGVSLTWPAPFARIRNLDVQVRRDDFPKGEAENLMLTGDQNVVDLAYSVRWDIASAADYSFQLREPAQSLRDAAESAMRAVLATTSFAEATGSGRNTVEARVAAATQRILDGYRSGIRIQGVSVRQASAPARINEAFNAVTVAQREADGNLSSAQADASKVISRAQGDAAAFDKYYAQYRLAPEVTRRRMYYETMEAVLARSDKTVVEAPNVTPFLSLSGARTLSSPSSETTVTADRSRVTGQ